MTVVGALRRPPDPRASPPGRRPAVPSTRGSRTRRAGRPGPSRCGRSRPRSRAPRGTACRPRHDAAADAGADAHQQQVREPRVPRRTRYSPHAAAVLSLSATTGRPELRLEVARRAAPAARRGWARTPARRSPTPPAPRRRCRRLRPRAVMTARAAFDDRRERRVDVVGGRRQASRARARSRRRRRAPRRSSCRRRRCRRPGGSRWRAASPDVDLLERRTTAVLRRGRRRGRPSAPWPPGRTRGRRPAGARRRRASAAARPSAPGRSGRTPRCRRARRPAVAVRPPRSALAARPRSGARRIASAFAVGLRLGLGHRSQLLTSTRRPPAGARDRTGSPGGRRRSSPRGPPSA